MDWKAHSIKSWKTIPVVACSDWKKYRMAKSAFRVGKLVLAGKRNWKGKKYRQRNQDDWKQPSRKQDQAKANSTEWTKICSQVSGQANERMGGQEMTSKQTNMNRIILMALLLSCQKLKQIVMAAQEGVTGRVSWYKQATRQMHCSWTIQGAVVERSNKQKIRWTTVRGNEHGWIEWLEQPRALNYTRRRSTHIGRETSIGTNGNI